MTVAAPGTNRAADRRDDVASCAARIERRLNKLEGGTASVNYATEKATVEFDPARVSPGRARRRGRAGWLLRALAGVRSLSPPEDDPTTPHRSAAV